MIGSLDVIAIIGSLRRGSFTRRLVQGLKGITPESMNLEIVEIGNLPMYNEDLEEAPPPEWVQWRDRVGRADAVLFATPEYNRSIPGCLKNALDVASRPHGKSAWAGKPGAVLSASPGAIGGFGANHHLRQCLVYLDLPVLAQPEVYLGRADKIVNEQGEFVSEETRAFLAKFLDTFEGWIVRLRHGEMQTTESGAQTG